MRRITLVAGALFMFVNTVAAQAIPANVSVTTPQTTPTLAQLLSTSNPGCPGMGSIPRKSQRLVQQPEPQPQPYTPTEPQPYTPTEPQPYTPTEPQPYTPTEPQPYTPTEPQPYTPTTPGDPTGQPDPGNGGAQKSPCDIAVDNYLVYLRSYKAALLAQTVAAQDERDKQKALDDLKKQFPPATQEEIDKAEAANNNAYSLHLLAIAAANNANVMLGLAAGPVGQACGKSPVEILVIKRELPELANQQVAQSVEDTAVDFYTPDSGG